MAPRRVFIAPMEKQSENVVLLTLVEKKQKKQKQPQIVPLIEFRRLYLWQREG